MEIVVSDIEGNTNWRDFGGALGCVKKRKEKKHVKYSRAEKSHVFTSSRMLSYSVVYASSPEMTCTRDLILRLCFLWLRVSFSLFLSWFLWRCVSKHEAPRPFFGWALNLKGSVRNAGFLLFDCLEKLTKLLLLSEEVKNKTFFEESLRFSWVCKYVFLVVEMWAALWFLLIFSVNNLNKPLKHECVFHPTLMKSCAIDFQFYTFCHQKNL